MLKNDLLDLLLCPKLLKNEDWPSLKILLCRNQSCNNLVTLLLDRSPCLVVMGGDQWDQKKFAKSL